MTDQVISPDGKWMWTGTEWIPAPPSSPPPTASNIVMQDSVIAGDVNVSNNNVEDIKKAMIDALTEFDVVERDLNEPTGQELEKMDKVLQLSSQLIENNIQLEPNIEEILAKIAWKKRHTKPYPDVEESEKLRDIELSHLNRALELYQNDHDLEKSAQVMQNMLRVFSRWDPKDNRIRALSIAKKSLDLARKVPDRRLELEALDVLSWSDAESNHAEHKALEDKVRKRYDSAQFLKLRQVRDVTFLEGSLFITKFLEEKSWLNGPNKATNWVEKFEIARFYREHNKLEDAEKWFLLALEDRDEESWSIYQSLGELEIFRKNYQKAIDYYSLALKHADWVGVREICLLQIAFAEESRGNVREAEEFRSRAISMFKSEYPKEKFTGTKEAIISTVEANGVANAKEIVEKYF